VSPSLWEGKKMIVDIWAETFWTVLNVRKKTLFDYKALYRRHLQPVIGQMEINDVPSVEIQKVLLGLSPQTAKHTLMVLKSMYREANLYKVSNTNPTQGLKTTPIRFQPKKFLTWDEVNALDWGKYNNQVRFVALHGLRWSEAVVITQEDVRDGFVWVSKSFHGDVKSSASNRKVPYLGFFEPLPMSYKTLRKAVNKHGINVHSLRRTYAYLLKTQGVHVTTAQKLLGHSDPMMTLKVYTSVLDSEIDDAGDSLRHAITTSSSCITKKEDLKL
jgi:integrase